MAESETSMVREVLRPYCKGSGLDVGFGGDPIIPSAICLDLPKPYGHWFSGGVQHLSGSGADLWWFQDECLNFVYSSHLIEDFTYGEQRLMVQEWVRVLAPKGHLIVVAPDQRRYVAHCQKDGTEPNKAHVEPDFCEETFDLRVISQFTNLHLVLRGTSGPYTWYEVLQKVHQGGGNVKSPYCG